MYKPANAPSPLRYLGKGCAAIFMVPVLSVWLAGSTFCAVLAPVAGILRTFGFKGIGMSLFPGFTLPDIWSLPYALLLTALLLVSAFYTRRLLKGCLQFIRE